MSDDKPMHDHPICPVCFAAQEHMIGQGWQLSMADALAAAVEAWEVGWKAPRCNGDLNGPGGFYERWAATYQPLCDALDAYRAARGRGVMASKRRDESTGPRANLRTPWKQPDECVCGHAAFVHVALPGHPDGAVECHSDGDDRDCECNRYRP